MCVKKIALILILIFALPCSANNGVSFYGTGCGVGEAGSAWTIEDDFSSDTESNYTYLSGSPNMSISGGTVQASGGFADFFAYHSTTLGSADQTVQMVWNYGSSGVPCLTFRVDTGGTGYELCYGDTTKMKIRLVDETFVSWVNFTGSNTWPTSTSHLVQATITSGNIYAYVDWNDDLDFGDADESYGPYADSTYSSGNYAGFGIDTDATNDTTMDDWKAVGN